MADEIIIRCVHCGSEIGRISYIPGKQVIGCKNCNNKTVVIIEKDGSIKTREPWG